MGNSSFRLLYIKYITLNIELSILNVYFFNSAISSFNCLISSSFSFSFLFIAFDSFLYVGINFNILPSIASNTLLLTFPFLLIILLLLTHLKLSHWIPVLDLNPSVSLASIISGKPFPYFWVLQGTIKLKNFLENNITPGCSYDGSYLKLVAPN